MMIRSILVILAGSVAYFSNSVAAFRAAERQFVWAQKAFEIAEQRGQRRATSHECRPGRGR